MSSVFVVAAWLVCAPAWQTDPPQAVEALARWRFDPAVLEGRPVASIVEVRMTFTLR